jgi:HAD superfamily hydrolase (TIGR01509 family)
MYVIFDMDGVIIDSEMVYRRGHMNAARLYGLPEDTMLEVSKKVTGVTIEMEHQTMIEAFGHLPQFDRDKVFRACRQYFDYIVETGKMELKPGAEEILRSLKGQEVTVGLASSSPRELIDKVLGRRGLLRFFDAVVSGDMVQRGKPDPEIFLTCAAQMGISSEGFKETYVIEDSHNGIRAAFDAGMQPVMVPDRLAPNEEMRQKAAVILPSLNDLIAWLHDRG